MRPLAALAALLLLGACADDVDPTLGTDQAFSVYGTLDPTADRQAVRVVPIVYALAADTARTLGATVTSVERETGRTAAWRDSVVTFADGTVGHVFVADYTPTAGATVELEVREPGREEPAAAVEVEVPALDRPRVGAGEATAGTVVYPVEITAPRVIGTRLVYHVVGMPTAPRDTVAVTFDAVEPLAEAGGGRWALALDFLATSRAFLRSPAVAGADLALAAVTVELVVGNAAWAVPVGGFDLDRIVEPGTFSNVAGGFGFVGGGYRTSATWTPSLTTQARAGFRVEEDPASVLVLNELRPSEGWVELYNPSAEAVPIGGYALVSGEARAEFPRGALLAPGRFLFQALAPSLDGETVELRAPRGTPVLVQDLGFRDALGLRQSFGSYPDGRSLPYRWERQELGQPPETVPADLFRGPLAPTPGAPNRLLVPVAVVNEVFSAGAEGWVELAVTPGPGFFGAAVTTNVQLPPSDWVRVEGPRGPPFLGVADETVAVLELPQLGGEVFVLAFAFEEPPRIYDVRAYGPQAPTTSSGLLPDFDRAGWRPGLRPTRGEPNAAARFAGR